MGVFFVSWELWQQMTFVLACAIVVVFCAGLIKLWTTNRIMRKREAMDEEKKARLQEMRRTGLTVKRGNDVPFGVRAIQSGIEVEGIWISRPPSPNFDHSSKLASSATLVGLDSDSSRKGKYVSDDTRSISASTYKQGQSDGSVLQKLRDSDSYDSTPSGTPPASQFSTQAKQQHTGGQRSDDADSLGTLDGRTPRTLYDRPMYETYMPTSAPQGARQSSQRSLASSSGDSIASSSHSSSQSTRFYASRTTHDRSAYSAVPQVSPEIEPRDPFETPLRTPTGFSTMSHSAQSTPLMGPQELAPPEPTFGAGDLHVNRKSRKVNHRFEVLPAGTFGVPQEAHNKTSVFDEESLEEQPQNNRISRISNRLRKKSVRQTQQQPGGQPF